jgi:hypothetical protein
MVFLTISGMVNDAGCRKNVPNSRVIANGGVADNRANACATILSAKRHCFVRAA